MVKDIAPCFKVTTYTAEHFTKSPPPSCLDVDATNPLTEDLERGGEDPYSDFFQSYHTSAQSGPSPRSQRPQASSTRRLWNFFIPSRCRPAARGSIAMQQHPKRKLFARHTGPQPVTTSSGRKKAQTGQSPSAVAQPASQPHSTPQPQPQAQTAAQQPTQEETMVLDAIFASHFGVSHAELVPLSLLLSLLPSDIILLQQSRTRGPSTVCLLSSRTDRVPGLIGNAGDAKCRYLYQCARTYIQESHLNFWRSVENFIEFVLTHPNGWEGQQQEEQSHVHLLTDGDVSLHFCFTSMIASHIFSKNLIEVSDYSDDEEDQSDSQGIIVVDPGGGTTDLSAYSMKLSPTSFEEIAPAECEFRFPALLTAYSLLKCYAVSLKTYSKYSK
ncbi:hypothetical protein DEU56DRAFT_985131 [Suillus clintonianus]|uniref:uncharacterized protein n=1 Tax=Suillus clintonianus TaxID=1904413 RepID=UPI001B85C8BA|nr:uncharacterized protein DEU56DRAFT_985131 [Suillus clintonianus]KAG2114518.1 hypothetical protein DEU56DRAFT_985131 [Suillus clintonianus]